MLPAQYCRIETAAGGVGCTHREFIRACHGVLSTKGKSRGSRTWRHEWIREGFTHLENSRRLFYKVATGSASRCIIN